MQSKSRQLTFSLILLIFVIGGAVWFVTLEQKQEAEPIETVADIKYPENFFTLTVYDKNIAPEKLEKWRARFEKAKQDIKTSPDGFHFAGVLDLGAIKKYVGDYEGARDAWIFLGEQRPLNSISFGNLGDLYANFLKEPINAEKAYLKAIENDPEDVTYYVNLSNVYRYLIPDKQDQADDILLKGIEAVPDDSYLYNYLASYYVEKGEKEKAIEYFNKSLEIEPSNETIRKAVEELKK